jgi:hypothetical protein
VGLEKAVGHSISRLAFFVAAIMILELIGVVWSPNAALAKRESGRIKVMGPSGDKKVVGGAAARAWWEAFDTLDYPCCTSPKEAAKVYYRVHEGLSVVHGYAPVYLVWPVCCDVGWSRSWFLYPSSKKTSAYLVQHGTTQARGRLWDTWIPVTERMERIITRRLDDAKDQRNRSLTATKSDSRTLPGPPLPALGLLVATATLVGLILAVVHRRRSALAKF